MLRKLLSKKRKIFATLMLVVLLASVRAFENELFYDPFSLYFKGEYLNAPFPEYDSFRLFCGIALRYFVNAVISLGIIYVLFKDLTLTKFTALLYAVFFAILIVAFFLLLRYSDSSQNFVFFYVRRFLIQPLFLLLFIPAFYYQKRNFKK